MKLHIYPIRPTFTEENLVLVVAQSNDGIIDEGIVIREHVMAVVEVPQFRAKYEEIIIHPEPRGEDVESLGKPLEYPPGLTYLR